MSVRREKELSLAALRHYTMHERWGALLVHKLLCRELDAKVDFSDHCASVLSPVSHRALVVVCISVCVVVCKTVAGLSRTRPQL